MYKRNQIVRNPSTNVRRYKIEETVDEFLKLTNEENGGNDELISNHKYNTYHRRKSDLKKFINFRDKQYKSIKFTDQISTEMIKDYISYLSNLKTKKGKMYKENTRFTIFTSFRSYINYLNSIEAIKVDAYNFILKNKFGIKGRKLVREQNQTGYLETEQIVEMYNRLEIFKKNGTYYRNKVLLDLLVHGFRKNEILELKWADFDFEMETLHIYHKKVTKQDTVYLSKKTIEDIKEYFESLTPAKRYKSNYMFLSKQQSYDIKGKHISDMALIKLLDVLCKDMHDSNGCTITPRTFRKTFVVVNSKIGTPIPLIQNYTEHNVKTLEEHYSTYIPNKKNEPADIIEDYFSYVLGKKSLKDIRAGKITVEDVLKDAELVSQLTPFFFNMFNMQNAVNTSTNT